MVGETELQEVKFTAPDCGCILSGAECQLVVLLLCSESGPNLD